jgi:DNA-binding Lrp family transcriptional regulator
MQESVVLDELDLALINCLEIDPRASWRRLGAALEVDPVTIARRWQRLSSTGTAWITGRSVGHRTPESCLAVVEVDCTTTRALDIAHRLAAWPHVLSVEHVSGNRALTLFVEVLDMASLSRFLLESLAAVPGIVATRTHLVTKIFTMGDQWQLKVLDASQLQRLHPRPGRTTKAGTGVRVPGSRPLDLVDRQLILCLGQDGRAALVDLASATGLSVSSVRRRLDDLIRRGDVVFRCDVALPQSGWPIAIWIWGYADPNDAETINTLLRKIPGTRVCLRISGGRPNLLLGIAARSLHEVPAVEAQLALEAPRLTVLDRSMVLRFIKRMGRLLDGSGRSVRSVPMDIWSDPTVSVAEPRQEQPLEGPPERNPCERQGSGLSGLATGVVTTALPPVRRSAPAGSSR